MNEEGVQSEVNMSFNTYGKNSSVRPANEKVFDIREPLLEPIYEKNEGKITLSYGECAV